MQGPSPMIKRYSPMPLAHHKRTTGETREKRATRRPKAEVRRSENPELRIQNSEPRTSDPASFARTEFFRSRLDLSRVISIMFMVVLLAACGEPMFDNAGSPNSLLEDREACVIEMEKSPAAIAYRQNPTAHPEYVSQVFHDVNQCIERKGWKQVRSQQEQERVREATTSELTHSAQPAGLSDAKAREAITRAVEDKLVRSSNAVR